MSKHSTPFRCPPRPINVHGMTRRIPVYRRKAGQAMNHIWRFTKEASWAASRRLAQKASPGLRRIGKGPRIRAL